MNKLFRALTGRRRRALPIAGDQVTVRLKVTQVLPSRGSTLVKCLSTNGEPIWLTAADLGIKDGA